MSQYAIHKPKESALIKLVQVGMHAGKSGGVDRYFDGLMEQLLIDGIPVMGYVFGESATNLPANVELICPEGMKINHRLNALKRCLEQSCIEGKTQVIASHFPLYTLPALKMQKKYHGIKIISHFHGPWAHESAAQNEYRFMVAMKKFLERRVLRKSDLVVADSNAFANLAVTSYRLDPSKVTHVHAGIHADPFFAMVNISKSDARARLRIPHNKNVVFTVRRLVPRMGLDRLLDATRKLVAAYPELLIIIGGKGPLTKELQTRVRALGLEKYVRLMGYVSEDDLPYAYRAADLSIVPSTELEGFGLVILESLACGTPVMVTPVGGMPEIIKPLCPGLILEGSGPEEIAAGLNRFLSHELLTPSEKACQSYIRQRYSWKAIVEQLLDLYGCRDLVEA